jgi:hypothetical protein
MLALYIPPNNKVSTTNCSALTVLLPPCRRRRHLLRKLRLPFLSDPPPTSRRWPARTVRQDAIRLRPASVVPRVDNRHAAATARKKPSLARHASPLRRAQPLAAAEIARSDAGTSARRQSVSRSRRTILFIPMALSPFTCLAPPSCVLHWQSTKEALQLVGFQGCQGRAPC